VDAAALRRARFAGRLWQNAPYRSMTLAAHDRSFPALSGLRVLIIAAHSSYRIAPYLAAARSFGLDIQLASQGEHAIAANGVGGVRVDLDNPETALATLIEFAKPRRLAAVIGADDATAELASRLAAHLGLPHNAPQAARFARRKDLARARLAQAGVAVPRHWRIDLTRALAPQIEPVEYPCVAKPVAMSASRGVIRADTPAELLQACARIERILADEAPGEERSYLLVERFIPGFEVAVEGLLTNGELEILAIFDKPDPLDGPFFEETYYITPTRLGAATQGALRTAVVDACRAYGLVHGPIHAECRVNDRGVWVLEIAARTIGGLCGRLLRFGTGYGLEELVLAHALGVAGESRRHEGAAGVLMIPIPHAGILRRVEGLMAAQQVRYIDEVNIQVREGYELVPLPEGASYLGFVFAHAPTAAATERALRAAHARLRFVVAPLFRAKRLA
jgi:biotin carboxylase